MSASRPTERARVRFHEQLTSCEVCRPSLRNLRRPRRLNANIGAAAFELSAEDLREIESAASKITVQGARYPEHLERMTGRWPRLAIQPA
jgi:hypothetical protein